MVGGAGMGAEGFAELRGRELSMVGMAGITLEQYASCLGAQLPAAHGVGLGVQTAHRSDVRELLADLSDASQPRFGELALQLMDVENGGLAVAAARGARAGTLLYKSFATLFVGLGNGWRVSS